MRSWVWGAAGAAGLILAGCSSTEPGAEHPVDAAEYVLRAVAGGDHETVCDMLGDAERGALPEGQRDQCTAWAEGIAPNLTDDQRSELEGVTVNAVTLSGDGRARLGPDDYDGISLSLEVSLVKSGERWFVEDVAVDGERLG